jgi:hypothetical protein
MSRPKKYTINLMDNEIIKLRKITRNKNTSKTVLRRCQVLLDLDEGHGNALTHEQAAKSNIYKLVSLERNVNSDNARRKLDGRAEAEIIAIGGKLDGVLHCHAGFNRKVHVPVNPEAIPWIKEFFNLL